ncbi:ubiquitin carboxyl-terminal hydrolase [Striga asiatica]|uniref:ubiquitinyl hydrolase 1 n=1 Tax=Striga asiatica TaxID=4170 RepID=A0A5A7PWB4_STRAF|nr:ubiquitin carboxyl-terminal hydrolase [Striga asiatica]
MAVTHQSIASCRRVDIVNHADFWYQLMQESVVRKISSLPASVSVATTKAKKKTQTLLEFQEGGDPVEGPDAGQALGPPDSSPADEIDNWVNGKKSSPARFGESNFPLLTAAAATKTEKKSQTLSQRLTQGKLLALPTGPRQRIAEYYLMLIWSAGSKNLDKAIASSSDQYKSNVIHFFLNPYAPEEGIAKKEYYLSRFRLRDLMEIPCFYFVYDLVVTKLSAHVLECKILTGDHEGEKVLILRMTITSSDVRISFKFQRRQFPIMVSYVMTINKSQRPKTIVIAWTRMITDYQIMKSVAFIGHRKSVVLQFGNVSSKFCFDLRVVVAVVFAWLVGRWKWRCAAARGEDIRRLMMLASEETARAELEAASGYRSYGSALAAEPVVEGPVSGPGSYVGRKLQYQCEVCFSPTTTRCKKCKSTHYCSRNCQVLHWRKGHKDECHSITTRQNTVLDAHPHVKEFKQDKIENGLNGTHVLHSTRPLKPSSEKCEFSNPTPCIPGEANEIFDSTSEGACDKTENNVKSSIHLCDESLSFTISTDLPAASYINSKGGYKYEAGKKKLFSEQPSSVNPEHTADASIFSNQVKSGCIERDVKSESSSSLGCSSFDSEEHLSEPSTLSDFWAGAIERRKPNINAVEFDDVKKLSSQPPFLPSSTKFHAKNLGSGMNGVQGVGPHPNKTSRKSDTLSEVSENGLKSKEPLVSSGKVSGQNDITYSSKEESKPSSCNAKGLPEERCLPSKNINSTCNLLSVGPKVVGLEAGGANYVSPVKSQHNDSMRCKSSETHLPSGDVTKKSATVTDAQSMENVYTREDDSRSLASGTNHPSSRRVVDEFRHSNLGRLGSFGAGGGIIGRYEVGVKGSFAYELFVKLYHWNEVELRPRGLKNCGNSCYANAVLQCLALTPPLTAYFLQGLHGITCHNKEWCFTCEMEALVKKAKEGNFPLSPARLMSQMHHGREEDAHEFLRYAIDVMQIVCLKDAGINAPTSLDEDTTLLGFTFGGYLQSKIRCMRCGAKSKQHERMMDLTLEIGGEIGSLEDALHQFTRSEILDGENKYRCDRCKSYEKAKKRLRVMEAPNVLTIALKRFQSGEFGKLNKSVKFPEVLNLAPYMRGTSDKSPIYQLYGAVIHLDVKNATFTGHYMSYVKNNKGSWFKADDSLVQAVEVERVLSKDAYMLFYARCSPRAPRLIRSFMDPRKSKQTTNKLEFHPTEPWRDVSLSKLSHHHRALHIQTGSEDENLTEHSALHIQTGSEDENLTEHSSFFSDTVSRSSCSTSTADSFSGMNSPSSSSSLSSPVRVRHSLLADLDRYSSDAGCSKINGDGFTCRNSCVNFDSDRLARKESGCGSKFSGIGSSSVDRLNWLARVKPTQKSSSSVSMADLVRELVGLVRVVWRMEPLGVDYAE